MTFDQIMDSLKARNFQPVYFLHGKESYFIDQISDYVERNVLTEGERSFNQTVLYGKDTEYQTLRDIISRYPMMAERQVVILKEAQEMKTLSELATYLENPVPSTLLIICYKHKKFDGRTKFGKLVKKHSVMLEIKPVYDNQMPDWITSYLKRKKLDISANAAQLTAEYLGTDLSKVANELDKLAINVPKGTKVSVQHIQDNIGISKDYNVFELQKALGLRQVLKANRIVNYFIANPKQHPLMMVIPALYSYFSKLYLLHHLRGASDPEIQRTCGIGSAYFIKEYKAAVRQFPFPKIKQVISILSEYDLRAKGVHNHSTDHGALLKEMVFKILH